MSAETKPGQVFQVGDTVTVVVENSRPDVPAYTVKGEVHHDATGRPWVGPIALLSDYSGGPLSIALTAHQPAPEPEPECKPGTLALLSLLNDDLVPRAYRTSIGTWHSIDDNRSWSDEDVNYVHEVVVINPADVDVDALAEALRVEWSGKDLDVTFSWSDIAKTVLTELGIEATS